MSPAARLSHAVRLFLVGAPWTPKREKEWRELTGGDEATTKALCDFARSVRAAENNQ